MRAATRALDTWHHAACCRPLPRLQLVFRRVACVGNFAKVKGGCLAAQLNEEVELTDSSFVRNWVRVVGASASALCDALSPALSFKLAQHSISHLLLAQ